MGWINLPATAGTDIQDYRFVSQFWFALRERYQAAGMTIWPESSAPWGDGFVPAGITETSFTDSDANAGHGWADSTYDNPWRGIPGPIDWSPRSAGWYLVIDHCDDPTKVVKTRITSWTATTLDFESINDQIVAGYVSLAELVGQKYFIIRGDWGLWWHERVLEFPSDYEFATGVVAEHFDDPNDPSLRTNPTDHSVRDAGQQWSTGEHVGRHLLVSAAGDGRLRRVTVTGNTADVLTFAAQTWTPEAGGNYCLVPEGGRAYPGKAPVYPFACYRGHFDPDTVSHFPSPVGVGNYYVQPTPIPAKTVGHDNAGDVGCITKLEDAFDRDVHLSIAPSSEQLACDYPTDKFLTPDFWKSLRAVQVGCESVCGYYVENTSFDGRKSIPPFVPATLFQAAGINTASGLIDAVDFGGTATLRTPLAFATPVDLHYAVLNETGAPYKYGVVTAATPTSLSDSGSQTTGPFQNVPPPGNSDVGRTIVLSPGWSRSIPREFRYMFDKTCFVPSTSGDPEAAVDAPAVVDFAEYGCRGVGAWNTRPKSTSYVERDIFGPRDSEPFVKDQITRYVGDNWNDPIAKPEPLVKYDDHFYTGQFPVAVQTAIDAEGVGAATAGGATYLTDDGQDWWDPKWYTVQVNMHVETGTGGSGSSTTNLRDTSKAEGESNCWSAASRFPDAAGPYVGFTVEILMSGSDFDDPDAVVEKRLIHAGRGDLDSPRAGIAVGASPFCASAWPPRDAEPVFTSSIAIHGIPRLIYPFGRGRGGTRRLAGTGAVRLDARSCASPCPFSPHGRNARLLRLHRLLEWCRAFPVLVAN